MTFEKKSTFWLLSILIIFPTITQAQVFSKNEIKNWYESAIQLTNKNVDSSFLIASKIFEISTKINYEEGKIKAKIISGYYYWDKFKLDTAKLLLNECIHYLKEHSDEDNALDHGRAWLYLGLVFLRQQDTTNAKYCGNNALSLFRKINDAKYIGNALNFLGGLQVGLTNYPAALDYFTKAYKIKIDAGEPEESCVAEIYNISIVYSFMGLYNEAINYARQSYNLSKEKKDGNIVINSLNKIASIYTKQSNIDSALFYFNKAKREAIAYKNTSMLYVVKYNIANTYSNYGKYKEASVLIRNLLSYNNQLRGGMYDGIRALHSKNYLNSDQYDSAILTARYLYKEVAKKGNKQMVINVAETLWKAFLQQGEYDSAFKYLNIHSILKDSIYNVANQRKLSSLYAEMESLEKENEIKILESEKEIQAIENRNLIIIIISGSAIATLVTISIVLAFKNREKKQKLKNLLLQDAIDKNKNDLNQQALRIIYINNTLSEIENSLRKLKLNSHESKTQDIQQLLNMIHVNKTLEKEWETFSEYFGSVHGDFYEIINIKFPELSTSEKRLASLIKMNLTNREIASILNIESSSVKMAKYRLKKKLSLEEEVDIQSFFQSLN